MFFQFLLASNFFFLFGFFLGVAAQWHTWLGPPQLGVGLHCEDRSALSLKNTVTVTEEHCHLRLKHYYYSII